LLLVMFVPQILLYITAGTGGAVMNANGRFALAAGAPALENAGIITVLIAAAVVFGTSVDVGRVSNAELVLIGLGTTGAVGLHAGAQWIGARSSGLTLIPRAGWKDPEVLAVVRRIFPTLAYTGLAASQIFAVFVVADRVRGGLVSFQLAMSFFYLPSAIVTWPIARALLPQLVRLHQGGHGEAFRLELLRGVHLASFITIPTAVAYAVLAIPMARAMTFGQLGSPGGVRMVALSMASLAVAVIGETWFILGTYAYYAQQNVRAPLRSMLLRVGVSSTLMAASWPVHGPAVLPLLGLALSAGSLVGAVHMWARLRGHLGHGWTGALRPLARTTAVSICMIIPAAFTAWACGLLPDTQLTQVLSMLAAAIVGAGIYLFLQGRLGAPELGWLKTALAGLGPAATTKE
jgi:putative peptidoglycan lipid II flippase